MSRCCSSSRLLRDGASCLKRRWRRGVAGQPVKGNREGPPCRYIEKYRGSPNVEPHLSLRIAVLSDLKHIIERREVLRSLRTASKIEAAQRGHHLAAAIYSGFAELRRRKHSMSVDQLRALAQVYLWNELDEAESMAANVVAENATSNLDAIEIRSDQLIETLGV